MNIYELRRHYSIHSDDQSHIICGLIDLLETKDDEIEFWMGEGDARLCEEDVEWRKLAAISHEDRTEDQNNRIRDLATIIREKHDEGLLWAKIQRLEAGLIQIDNMRNATQVKGGLCDIGVPNHLIDDDGFVPMSPDIKIGMTHAANVERETLRG